MYFEYFEFHCVQLVHEEEKSNDENPTENQMGDILAYLEIETTCVK
jgi:hypothetical protein